MFENKKKYQNAFAFRFPSDGEWLFLLTFFVCLVCCCAVISHENFDTFFFHVIFLVVSVFFVFLSDLSENSKLSLFLFFGGVFLLAFPMAFRNLTGIDDRTYEIVYLSLAKEDAQNLSLISGMEKGYLFLNVILSKFFGLNYLPVQTIVCYMSFLFWGIGIWNYRGKCCLSVMILLLWSNYYFFVLSAGLVRIFIALPILFIAFNMISKKKIWHFIVLTILASCFHKSALIGFVCLPLFWENALEHWKRYVVIVFFVTPFVFLSVAKFLVPILGARYAGYGNVGDVVFSLGRFDMFPMLFFCGYFLQFVESKNRNEFIVGMILLSFSIIFSVWSSMVPLGRLIFYANLGILIMGSKVFKQKPVGIIELFAPSFFIVYSFFYVMHCCFLNPNPLFADYLYPYECYLFN